MGNEKSRIIGSMTLRRKSTHRVRRFRKQQAESAEGRPHRMEVHLSLREASQIWATAKRWKCSRQEVLRMALYALEPVFKHNLAKAVSYDLFARARDHVIRP
jgi:hypothetical protein